MIYIDYQVDHAVEELKKEIATKIKKVKKEIVIICIGTDRSTGDSLGPLVGTFLKEELSEEYVIYGTIDEPIHAQNLELTLEEIEEKHPDKFVIAIDACLGHLKTVGKIKVNKGALRPGAGVNKELPSVGDIHIFGIVNVGGYMEVFVLQNTRLKLVYGMAKVISKGLSKALIEKKAKDKEKNNGIFSFKLF